MYIHTYMYMHKRHNYVHVCACAILGTNNLFSSLETASSCAKCMVYLVPLVVLGHTSITPLFTRSIPLPLVPHQVSEADTGSSFFGFTRHTLDTLARDHRKFLATGGDVKKVKEYRNVLQEPFFE